MARLKKRYWLSLSILIFITILGLFGWRYWQEFKQEYGFSINWQGAHINLSGLSFDQLIVNKEAQFTVTAKDVVISWSKLSAQNLNIDWQTSDSNIVTDNTKNIVETASEKQNQSGFDYSFIPTIVYWLPSTIDINSLRVYEQNQELFDVKITATKQQQGIHVDVSANNQYVANLSATLLFNQNDLRIDIQNGVLTTTLNQFGIENGKILLPFTGWITNNRFELTNSGNASVTIEKANLSDDSIFSQLNGALTFKVQSPIPVEPKQILATAKLNLNKFNGIYKNSEINSATGNINIDIKNKQFTVSVPTLNIQEINMGIALQQVKLSGSYTASFNSPNNGTIIWKKAQADIFSGSIFLEASRLNLAKLPQQFNLRLKQIQLKDIFATYPAEGLAGEGAIDGLLPITLLSVNKKEGVTFKPIIKKGQLTTTNQGYLQFENSALKNYAKSNPNMKILTDIIKNFHYTKLDGTVDYADDVAKLGLHIQGHNLDVEDGKAVNLNVTLEENIAKLLMSLQLSDQISEPIRKRIEANLKKESAK